MTHHSKGFIWENKMHYILKLECSEVMVIIARIGPFFTVFPNILVNLLCKGSWLAYNKITYTKRLEKLF